jgi:hypothetical protein
MRHGRETIGGGRTVSPRARDADYDACLWDPNHFQQQHTAADRPE